MSRTSISDGVLALDLAGVNAALDHDHDLVGLGRGFRREGAILGDDQRDHGAAFGRGADVEHLDEARGALQAVRDLDGFGVRRGLVPVGLFAGGEQIGRRGLGAGGERCGGLGGGRFDRGVRRDRVLRTGECSHQSIEKSDPDHDRVW